MLMNTNNPAPAPPPFPIPPANESNQYDFITKGDVKPRRGLGSMLSGNSTTQRIIFAVGGLLILLIIGIMLMSYLGKSSKGDTEALIGLAQQQTELARVAAVGVEKGTSPATKYLATTAQLSIESSRQDVIALLKKGGHKVGEKTLASKKNAETDNQLDDAAQNNTFDGTFTEILNEELTSYSTSLSKAYNSTQSDSERQILKNAFNSAKILIGDKATN